MDNQLKNLECFENLVSPNGVVVIMIPVKLQPIWEKYVWIGLKLMHRDIFSYIPLKVVKYCVAKTNPVVEDIIFYSFDNCFFSCEKYARDISMRNPNGMHLSLMMKQLIN